MPRTNAAAAFAKVMSKLMAQRKKHLAVIARSSAKVAEVDGMFAKFGISLEAAKPVAKGGKQAKKAKGRRRRGTFKQTAEEFVLGLLKGGRSLTTAALNQAWKKAGRGGKADNTLTKLFQGKQVKRQKAKEGKGSVYSVA
jgi:hypothetical protein